MRYTLFFIICFWITSFELVSAQNISTKLDQYLSDYGSLAGELDQCYNKNESACFQAVESKLNRLIKHSAAFLEINDPSLLARMYHKIGAAQFEGGKLLTQIEQIQKYNDAISSFLHSLDLRQNLKPSPQEDIVRIYINLALVNIEMYRYSQAIEYLNQAIQIFQSLNAPFLKGLAYYELGVAYFYLHDYYQTIESCQQAIIFFPTSPNLYRAWVYNLLGEAHVKLKQSSSAIEYYKKASDIYNVLNNEKGEAECAHNITKAYLQREDKVEAFNSANRASRFYREDASLQGKNKLAQCYNNLGVASKHLGKVNESESYLKQALTLYRESGINSGPGYAEAYDNLGDLSMFKKDYGQALIFYQAAIKEVIPSFKPDNEFVNPSGLDTVSILGSKSHLLIYLSSKAEAIQKITNIRPSNDSFNEKALELYHLADSLIFRMRREHKMDASKLFWIAKTRSVYEQAIALCLELGEWEEAFAFMERSKSVLLLAALREAEAMEHVGKQHAAILQKEDVLLNALTENNLQLENARQKDIQAQLDRLQQIQDSLGNEYDRFIIQLKTDYPQYFEFKYQESVASLGEVQQYLKNQAKPTAIIEYFEGDSNLYVCYIDPDTIALLPLEKETVLLNQFFLAISPNSESGLYQPIAFRLYEKILAPIQSEIGLLPEKLILIPDGNLFKVPFEALVIKLGGTRFDNLEYFIKNHTNSYAYSASILLHNPSLGQAKYNLLAMVPENFSYDDSLFTIKDSHPDNDILVKRLGGRLLHKENACKTCFFEQARDFRILHFYTHAGTKDRSHTNPWIAFFDQKLFLPELYGLNLQAEMVWLGACQTSSGDLLVGEGMESFVRAFRYIRVPSVVGTLWKVPSRETAQITQSFYQYIKDGMQKDEALCKAKRNYLNSLKGIYASPYYWAGSLHYGNPEELFPSMKDRILQWGGLLLLVIMVVVVWVRYRKN